MPSKFGNDFMAWMIRSPLWPLMGDQFSVITVHGRKTGREISTPINTIKDAEGYTVISSRDRTWWRNLRGGAPAGLYNAGKTFSVMGQVFESDGEVKSQLASFLTDHPGMGKYLKVTIDQEGKLNEADLNRLAGKRVVIKLQKISNRTN